MPHVSSDGLILDYLRRVIAEDEPAGELTYQRINDATGVSIPTIWKRLTKLRDRGVLTWQEGSLATLHFLHDVGRAEQPVAPPIPATPSTRRKPASQCSARGCTDERSGGGQWCRKHELDFIERSRMAVR